MQTIASQNFNSTTRFLKQLAILVVAGALYPAAARAQAPDTVRGLQMQRIGEGISPNLPISMYRGPYRRSGPSALVYINGQLSNDSALARLNPDDIAAIIVLKESDTRKLNPDTVQAGALLVTTKAGEHTHAVRAFNRRLAKMDLMPPTGPK